MKLFNFKLLNQHFLDVHNIDQTTKRCVKKISPLELLKIERIDLIAKMLFLEYLEDNSLTYFLDIYREHLLAFGVGKIFEGDYSGKKGLNKFTEVFLTLYQNISIYGFDANKSVIPINQDKVILDGSHRISVAIKLNIPVPVVEFYNINADYGYQFFKSRYLDDDKLQFMALRFTELKDSIRVLVLWPRALRDLDNYQSLINYEKILYQSDVSFTYNGFINFIVQIYKDEKWIGKIEENFKGAHLYANRLLENKSSIKIRFYLIDTTEKNLLKIKEKIRSITGLSNLAAHSSDNQQETLSISRLLLNKNSLHHLNFANLTKYKKSFKRLLAFKKLIIDSKIDLNSILIDSSSVLAAYGLREANDLDFISLEGNELIENQNDFDLHNDQYNLTNFSYTLSQLIKEPQNHFYFFDVKFMSLQTLKEFKSIRGEKKDIDDVKLINAIYNTSKLQTFLINASLASKRHIYYKYLRSRIIIIRLLTFFRLKKFIKSFLLKFKS